MAARVSRRLAAAAALALAALATAFGGCGGTPAEVTPPAASGPPPSQLPPATGPGAAATRAALFAALRDADLVIAESAFPYRPAEAAPLAAAPRNVYQVALQGEPEEGFIVVYEFATDAEAVDAAKAQHAYLSSGPGRVQSPPGTDHVLQQLGPTVIAYEWLPADARDPAAPRIAETLRTLGTSFVVGP